MKARLADWWTRRPRRWAWPLWACVGLAVVGIGFRREENTTDRLERQDDLIRELIHRDEIEDEVDDARRCVAAWVARAEIRDGIRKATTAGAEALISIAGPDAEQETIDSYRAAIVEQGELAAAELPDPDCDRERAQRVLDDPDYADAVATDDT